MDLQNLQKNWDQYGKVDPLWAILTKPEKRHGGWDLDEFFQTGVKQIGELLTEIEALKIPLQKRAALDFGCGVGRLTQALGDHFETAHGVDIAPSMIEQAQRYNRHGDRCRYHLNETDNLALFPDDSFDLVYSYVVLHHMRPEYALAYISEFVRVLAPGGVISFQLAVEQPTTPLPESGFQVRLEPINAPTRLHAGESTPVRVRVHNASDVAWSAPTPFNPRSQPRLGNHWVNLDGVVVVQEDSRADLAESLPPGAETELTIVVTAPEAPGSYFLEFDMLEEGVAWFASRGCPAVRVAVDVQPALKTAPQPAENAQHDGDPKAQADPHPDELIMEMYGVKVETVQSVIEAAGGRLVEVKVHSGGDWTHGLYTATK